MKLIGDEVMFVVVDPRAACRIARDLVDQLEEHATLPSARVGLAAGDVLTRDGDYFGTVVNLAARAVKLAAPTKVVVSESVSRGASSAFEFASLGEQRLKGFELPIELFELSR